MRGYPQGRWHLDEAFVKVNGKLCYLWRAVDHEGEVLEAVVTAKRVMELNEQALTGLPGEALEIVPHASHLFPEPGALEAVIDHAARWFEPCLSG